VTVRTFSLWGHNPVPTHEQFLELWELQKRGVVTEICPSQNSWHYHVDGDARLPEWLEELIVEQEAALV